MIRRLLVASILLALSTWLPASNTAGAFELVRRDVAGGNVVLGYKDTPTLPWTDGKYCVHDPDRPYPAIAEPNEKAEAELAKRPEGAIALFDGNDLSAWQPSTWTVKDGYVEAGHGNLTTKAPLGDCRLHLEWMAPDVPHDNMMNRGNSGVLLMGLYEVQIFDSHPMHKEQIYPDGQAASIYGETPPRVNVCRKPGQWQSFDIEFTAPVFEGDKLVKPARATVYHNGVLVHQDQEIYGPCAHRSVAPYQAHAEKMPLVLQGHGCPVRFRNIWVKPSGD